MELFGDKLGQKCCQAAQYEAIHGNAQRDEHIDGVGQETLEDLEDVHEVRENVWGGLSLVRPGRGVSLPVDAGGVAEDHAAHRDGPHEGDEEARPPGSNPERVSRPGLLEEVSVESEELTPQHVAHGGAHDEGRLEDGDVEGGRAGADALLQEGDAEGDQGSRPCSVQQLAQDEDVPVAGQGPLPLPLLLSCLTVPPGGVGPGLTEISTQRAVPPRSS